MTRAKKRLTVGIMTACVASVLCTGAFAHTFSTTPFKMDITSTAKDTGSVHKYHNGNEQFGDAFFFFQSANVPSMNLLAIMHDSSHTTSSKTLKIKIGATCPSLPNWGLAGYNYHMSLRREYPWDPLTRVIGTWSPDAAH